MIARRLLLPVLIVLFAAFFAVPAICGFHEGGPGECQGCHSMHGDSGVQEVRLRESTALLRGSDVTSTCLSCHTAPHGTVLPLGYFVLTSESDMPRGIPPSQLTPGGDFGWLKKDYRWGPAIRGVLESLGERHGHNIVAWDLGYVPDSQNILAPYGTYPSNQLSCVSCHDPHGVYRRLADGSIKTTGFQVVASGSYEASPDPSGTYAVGVYRMLGGKGYQPKYLQGAYVFAEDPPVAVAPLFYNRAEYPFDTRVAYGTGASEWCGNCHFLGGIHGAPFRGHPTGDLWRLTPAIIKHYNEYVASGNLTGTFITAYTSLVPFEMGTTDYAVLKAAANSDGRDRTGPDPTRGHPNVMCLSCHRAHASGWDNITRWNMKSEFLVYAGLYPGTDSGAPEELAQGRTSREAQRAFYERSPLLYATYQRSLCNKCHAKD